MKRFEKIVNYFVVTDVATGKEEISRPSKDIRAELIDGLVYFFDSKARINPIDGTNNYTLGLTSAVGSVELTGGVSGSVDGITVNAVEIMSGAVAFNTDLPTTAQDVADNINANTSTPNYTATVSGNIISITSVDKGTAVNGFVVVSTVTTITKADINMAGATANLVKTGDVPFADVAELNTFLRTNTGA